MSANLEVPRAPEDAVWRFRSLTIHDGPALAEVRAAAMRPSLERLGRYDDTRVRQRFLDAFDPTCAWGLELDGRLVGCVALRPEGDEY